jgi:hypothetical protein
MSKEIIYPIDSRKIASEITDGGYSFVSGRQIEAGVQDCCGANETDLFVESWDKLGLDRYLADGGRYRRRRFGVFSLEADGLRSKPHQPHFQSRDFNRVNGGIQRHFLPLTEQISDHPALRFLVELCFSVFHQVHGYCDQPLPWHTEVHQFRVEVNQTQEGFPTPEGMHRDGVDWVCVVLIKRQNVASGVTNIFNIDTDEHDSFTLERRFDSVFLDDKRVYHGVTPITQLDQKIHGYRDILVLTFRRE